MIYSGSPKGDQIFFALANLSEFLFTRYLTTNALEVCGGKVKTSDG